MPSLRVGAAEALPVEERRLGSGLRLLVLEEPRAEVFTIMLWVPAGVRTEPEGRSGISHYLEHCYSLGSAALGPREIDRRVEALGGFKNAFTSYDTTSYYESLPAVAFEEIVRLEADRLLTLALPPDRLATELDVVKEERRLRYENSPTGRLWETMFATAFERHPYRNPIIGTWEDLDRLDPDEVRAYYERHYAPGNCTFVISGGIDADRAAAAFEAAFDGAPSRATEAVVPPEEPPQTEARVAVIERESPPVPYVGLLYKTPGLDDPDLVPLDCLGQVLCGHRSGRLVRRLVRERRLADFVSGGPLGLRDVSPLRIMARARDGVSAERLEAALVEEMDDVIARGVEAPELDRARARLRTAALAAIETVSGRATSLGAFHVTSAHGWRYLERWLDGLEAVTPDDLARVARAHLRPEQRTAALQVPKGAATVSAGAGVDEDRVGDPGGCEEEGAGAEARAGSGAGTGTRAGAGTGTGTRAGAGTDTGAGADAEALEDDAYRMRLPEGPTLLYRAWGPLPLVAVGVRVEAGSAHDPAGRSGLAALTASLLRTGTMRRSEEALVDAFADLGTTLSVTRGTDAIELSCLADAHALAEVLALMGEIIREPAFAPDMLERARAEALSGRRASRGRAAELDGEAFRRCIYGAGHPYARPEGGTTPGLASVTVDDVRAFHAERYGPAATSIAVAGRFDPAALADAAAAAFSGWGRGPATTTRPPEVPPRPREGSFIVAKPDQSQAHLRVGQPLFPRSHPDWDAFILLNAILGGGGLSARIPARVRTRDGLAYSARSGFGGRRLAGSFSASAETRTERAHDALAGLEEEVARIAREPVEPEELERVRAKLVGTLPFRLERAGSHATILLNAEAHGLPFDYPRRQVERIASLGPDDLLDVARRHLRPDRLLSIAVGEPEGLAEALGDHGPLTPITEDELDAA